MGWKQKEAEAEAADVAADGGAGVDDDVRSAASWTAGEGRGSCLEEKIRGGKRIDKKQERQKNYNFFSSPLAESLRLLWG